MAWLLWLGFSLQTERLPVGFLVRARVWIVSLVPSLVAYRSQPIYVSYIAISLSSPPKKKVDRSIV